MRHNRKESACIYLVVSLLRRTESRRFPVDLQKNASMAA